MVGTATRGNRFRHVGRGGLLDPTVLVDGAALGRLKQVVLVGEDPALELLGSPGLERLDDRVAGDAVAVFVADRLWLTAAGG